MKFDFNLLAEAAETTQELTGFAAFFAKYGSLLMIVVMILGKAFSMGQKKAKTEAPAPAPAPAPVEAAPVQPLEQPAPGTAGQLKLYDTPPKTAAMLMAIVADKMGKPLNELRFISIKEVKDNEV